jgi:YggT family protein
VRLLILFLQVYQWIIIARAVVSWIPSIPRYHPAVRLLDDLTEPVLRPLRRIIPPEKTAYVDFTPLIVFFLIGFLIRLLASLAAPVRTIGV